MLAPLSSEVYVRHRKQVCCFLYFIFRTFRYASPKFYGPLWYATMLFIVTTTSYKSFIRAINITNPQNSYTCT